MVNYTGVTPDEEFYDEFFDYVETYSVDDEDEGDDRKCSACFGTGLDRNVDADCMTCWGDGYI